MPEERTPSALLRIILIKSVDKAALPFQPYYSSPSFKRTKRLITIFSPTLAIVSTNNSLIFYHYLEYIPVRADNCPDKTYSTSLQ